MFCEELFVYLSIAVCAFVMPLFRLPTWCVLPIYFTLSLFHAQYYTIDCICNTSRLFLSLLRFYLNIYLYGVCCVVNYRY